MNTSTNAKRILLYGDSFVYGKTSGKNERLGSKDRFSGMLQDQLGDGYEVIEEGLRARTLEGENGFFTDRDGLRQFSPIIGSHLPLDLLVIILGTNDCNLRSNKTPEQIAENMRRYPPILREWCAFLAVKEPQVLIIAPPLINKEYYDAPSQTIFGDVAPIKISALPELYAKIAEDEGFHYASAANVCEPARGDGIHLDKAGNKALADLLYKNIKAVI